MGFARLESVEIAISMMNQTFIRPGNKIEVAEAVFEQKGEEFHARKIQKTDKLTQMRIRNLQEQKVQVGFYDSDENAGVEDLKDKGPKIVVIQNMFTAQDVEEDDAEFFKELESDIRFKLETDLCSTFHLSSSNPDIIKKIDVFRNNTDGVVKVKFKTSKFAEKCIEIMNGRWFDKR